MGGAVYGLVAWHFSSLKLDAAGEVTQLANAEYALDAQAVRAVYDPYIAELQRFTRET